MSSQVTRRIAFGLTTGGLLAGSGMGFAHADAFGGPGFGPEHGHPTAAGSPGVLSGNSIQIPINIPVNLCGDSIDVVGLVNPTIGNSCVNNSSAVATGGHGGLRGHGGFRGHEGFRGGPGGPEGFGFRGDPDGFRGGPGGPDGFRGGPGGPDGFAGDRFYGGREFGHGGDDARADGGAVGSPGVLSGNNIQVPVNLSANVCGDTVDVVGVLNPAIGNHCVNGGHHERVVVHEEHGRGPIVTPGPIVGPGPIVAPVSVPVTGCGVGAPLPEGPEGVEAPLPEGVEAPVPMGSPVPLSTCGGPATTPVSSCTSVPPAGAGGVVTPAPAGGVVTPTPAGGVIPTPAGGVVTPIPAGGVPVTPAPVGGVIPAPGGGVVTPTPAGGVPVIPAPGGGMVTPTPAGGVVTPMPAGGVTPAPTGAAATTPSCAPTSVPSHHHMAPVESAGVLAHTGSDDLMYAPIAAAMMGGGAFLYRKSKPSSAR